MSEIGSSLRFWIVLCALVAIIVWTAPIAYQLYSGERPH
jgi:hypothetical protein